MNYLYFLLQTWCSIIKQVNDNVFCKSNVDMNRILFFIAFIFSLSNSAFAQSYSPFPYDSLGTEDRLADSIITEVITRRKVTPQDKVEYFSRVTQYGFKNLFKKTSYNATQPYSVQVNPHAESYMQDYLVSHQRSLINMKSWGTPYFNLIDNIFAQYGLPKELKYLAVIESNLSTNATSIVGAGGPWQFMPYTARDYGLVVSAGYDERRDYYKSTHAAARYLLSLYKDMKDWLLVIAAYNGGPGRVYSAMKNSGSRNFWDLQYFLPTESRNHVKKFIATHYIMEGTGGVTTQGGSMQSNLPNANNTTNTANIIASYNNSLSTLSEADLQQAQKLEISGKYSSVVIAKNIVMDISLFNKYNPGFDAVMQQEGKYEMILPQDKMQTFIQGRYQILNECVQILLSDNTAPQNTTIYPNKYKRKG